MESSSNKTKGITYGYVISLMKLKVKNLAFAINALQEIQ